MVTTISPVVHGGRTPAYILSLALHVLAATATAAAFGALLGGLGRLAGAPFGAPGVIALAAVALAYAARELLGLRLPTFDRREQVPEWWRTFFSPPVAALLYGAGLGIGFLTFLTFGTYVAVVAGAALSGDVVAAAVVTGAFGLARSAVLAIVPSTEPLEDRQDAARRVNGTVLVAVALAALTAI